MGARGRLSGSELSLVGAASGGQITVESRPDPPLDLTAEQSNEWRAVVASLPADWFRRETHALLSNYCRHAIASKRIAQMIDEYESGEEFDVDTYDKLLRMLQRESASMSSLATRMRMSQQSSYDVKTKKKVNTKKPWA